MRDYLSTAASDENNDNTNGKGDGRWAMGGGRW